MAAPDRQLLPPIFFEDLQLGQRFVLPSRTITEAHFSAFQALTGDNHPIHYDRQYCAAHGHRDLLAHGLHVAALTAAGAGLFPHLVEQCLVAFLDQSSRFLRPLYCGDTAAPSLEIVDLERQRSTGVVTLRSEVRNQSGALVLEGEHRYLLRLQETS